MRALEAALSNAEWIHLTLPASLPYLQESEKMIWQRGPAPQDGQPFWAFLYNTGIRELRWLTPQERAEHNGWGDDPEGVDGAYVEVADYDEEWEPDWWLPIDAIPKPKKPA